MFRICLVVEFFGIVKKCKYPFSSNVNQAKQTQKTEPETLFLRIVQQVNFQPDLSSYFL